jgi:hypothetical protein
MRSKACRIILTVLNLAVMAGLTFFVGRSLIGHPPVRRKLAETAVGSMIWGPRALDVLGQAMVLFACILGILLLFRTEDKE